MPVLSPMLLAVLTVVFACTQVGYFLANLVAWTVIYPRPKRRPERTELDEYPPLDVVIPIYRERRAVVEETLACVHAADYPDERVQVHVVYEEDDPVVTDYITELDVDRVPIWKEDPIWEQVSSRWGSGYMTSRNKARALDYALYALTLDESHVLTVLDSDSEFPSELFERGVAGLWEYDIVQAKQTVRNVDDGWLPLLESTGIAAWCDLIYEHTVDGPYQLLGKGYFVGVDTLAKLHGWNPEAATEDLSLGVAAHLAGYRLGTIDYYMQDLCPPKFRDWVRQKRRWVAGPYGTFTSEAFSAREQGRFFAFFLINQFVTLLNLVGVPAGAAYLVLTLAGEAPTLPLPLGVIVGLNLLAWIHYSVRSMQAADAAVPFDSRHDRLWYFLRSNPVTQLGYATLWSIPILLALWDLARGTEREFEVTPK